MGVVDGTIESVVKEAIGKLDEFSNETLAKLPNHCTVLVIYRQNDFYYCDTVHLIAGRQIVLENLNRIRELQKQHVIDYETRMASLL